MPEQPAPWRPDDETLAAYIDGRLSGPERARVEAAIAADPETYEWLAGALRAMAAEAEGRPDAAPGAPPAAERAAAASPPGRAVVRPFPIRHPWLTGAVGALAAAALVVLAVGGGRWWGTPPGTSADVVALADATGPVRLVEGRLVGGFAFGPLQSATRGGDDLDPRRVALLSIAARLKTAAEGRTTAVAVHDYGVARLLTGSPDEAVRLLSEAVDLEDRAAFRSDLATAYAARARERNDPSDWAKALDESARALRAHPDLPEALYTHALAAETLHLPAAADAWEAYLKSDSSSPWAADARQRLARLRETPSSGNRRQNEADLWAAIRSGDPRALRAAAARDPQRTREFLEEDLPAAWADAVTRGDGAAQQTAVGRLAALRAAYDTVADDRLPGRFVDMLATVKADADRRDLVGAVIAYRDAARLVREDRQPEAEPLLASAGARFDRLACPLAHWVRYYQAARAAQRDDVAAANALLDRVQRDADAEGFTVLSGIARARRAQILGRRGDHEAAIRERLASEPYFRRAADLDQVAVMHAMIAEVAMFAGDSTTAWRHHMNSLELLDRAANPRSRHLVLVEAGVTCTLQGLYRAALDFQDAVVSNGRAWARASAIASGLLQQAHNATASGESDRGLALLASARAELELIPEPAFRDRIEMDWLESEAVAYRSARPKDALVALDRAVERFTKAGYPVRLAELLLLRGETSASGGDVARAERDWAEAARLLEVERAKLTKDDLRVTQAGGLRRINATLALSRFRRGDPPAASLAPVERARARTLVEDALSADRGEPDVAAIQSGLPTGVGLLYIVLGRSEAVGWLVSHAGLTARRLSVTRGALTLLLKRYDRLAPAGHTEPAFSQVSRELHAALLGAFEPELATINELVLVPDPALTGVSFATLVDPRTGKYLIESHVVAVAPSGMMAVRARPAAAPDAALVVAADAPPGMPRLPWARVEAEHVAAVYRRPTTLIGADATPSALLRALGPARVIHFAGHAVANPAAPLLSRLLLSPDASGQSDVHAHDLAQANLAGSVVVLAACQSGFAEADATDDDAVLAMARPFLARGARSVVASYWDVMDAPSVDLMTDFHRRLSQGVDAPAAWQGAAIAAIAHGVPPSIWGSYGVFIGGRG